MASFRLVKFNANLACLIMDPVLAQTSRDNEHISLLRFMIWVYLFISLSIHSFIYPFAFYLYIQVAGYSFYRHSVYEEYHCLLNREYIMLSLML